jgi:aminoglycoside phosphotransferase (APT) family kinase protein
MTQITLDDISEAVRIGGLKDFEGNYESLGGGEINDTYLISYGDEKAILRIARHTDQNSLHQEAVALKLLNSSQIPELIYFDENSRINGRQWILESYISGNSINRLSVNQFNNFGVLLANIHRIKSGKVGINIWSCFLDECKMFGDENYLMNHPDDTLNVLISFARKRFEEWQTQLSEVPESLIHGDATPSNILLQNDTVSLIDWEFSKFKDPMAEFSTIFYDDMEYNQGRWRVHITNEEKEALYRGYTSAGGNIDENRVEFWMNFDKLGAAIFLYWRINQSEREASVEQKVQYRKDYDNLISSLQQHLFV